MICFSKWCSLSSRREGRTQSTTLSAVVARQERRGETLTCCSNWLLTLSLPRTPATGQLLRNYPIDTKLFSVLTTWNIFGPKYLILFGQNLSAIIINANFNANPSLQYNWLLVGKISQNQSVCCLALVTLQLWSPGSQTDKILSDGRATWKIW